MLSKDHKLYRHVETNKVYYVLSDTVVIEKTRERAVAYTRLQPTEDKMTHVVWITPYDEFMDGRFKAIKLKE